MNQLVNDALSYGCAGADFNTVELLEAVRSSLRAKVAALAEDNWMYEAEDDSLIR